MKNYTILTFILIFLFVLTAHKISYEEAPALGYSDTQSYCFIAEKGFDKREGNNYASHHLERWPLHITIGSLAKATNLDIWSLYRAIVLLFVFLTYLVIFSLKISTLNKIASFAFLLLNPYAFRIFYSVPGMVSDAAIYLGFVFVVCGFFNKSHSLIIGGVLLSIVGKQTSILLLPIFMVLFYLKYIKAKELLFYGVLIIWGFVFLKNSTVYLFEVSNPTSFFQLATAGIKWLYNDYSFKEGFSFFGRYILFLLSLSPLLFLSLEKGKNKIIFIAFFLFIHLQPIAGGPAVTGRNIQRLCALGLPFLLPLIFTARIELKNLYLFLSSSLLLSFHHNFSFLYYLGFGKTLFFSVILLNFAASLLVNKRQLKFSRDS